MSEVILWKYALHLNFKPKYEQTVKTTCVCKRENIFKLFLLKIRIYTKDITHFNVLKTICCSAY